MRRIAYTAATAAVLVSGVAIAASDASTAYLGRFRGEWTGSGTVQPAAEDPHRKVSCEASGDATETRVSLKGSCTAVLVFTRDIGADLKLDPATGRFTGTYIGSPLGPARLSGTRDGESLNLDVTWAGEVNGDRHSRMTITNHGDGRFSVRVRDQLGADGPTAVTTDIAFARK